MNRLQEIVKAAWDPVRAQFESSTQSWAAGVLMASMADNNALNALCEMIEHKNRLAQVSEDREKLRADHTTMMNYIRNTFGCGTRESRHPQEMLEDYRESAAQTLDDFERLERTLEYAQRQRDDYKKLADARGTRLDEVYAALECQPCHLFTVLDSLTGQVPYLELATETLQKIRETTECPDGTALTDWCEDLCAAAVACLEANQTSELRIKCAEKAVDDFVDLLRKRDEVLEFYANSYNYMEPDFFSGSVMDRDCGHRAKTALGKAGRVIEIEATSVMPRAHDDQFLKLLGLPVHKMPYSDVFILGNWPDIFENKVAYGPDGAFPYIWESRYGR